MTFQAFIKTIEKTPISKIWLGLYAVLLALSWLLPGHYLPWPGFQGDAWLSLMLLLGMIYCIRFKAPLNWGYTTIFISAMSLTPLIQYITGILPFAGQAWVATLYLLGFLLALIAGENIEQSKPNLLINVLFAAIVIASVVSVSLQLMTWLSLSDFEVVSIFAEPSPKFRPHANFVQPNLLATLLVWGCLGGAWAYVSSTIRAPLAVILVSFLLVGVTLTESRTAWLEISFIFCASWFWRALWPTRRMLLGVTGLFVFFWFCPLLLKAINNVLQLNVGDSFSRSIFEGNIRFQVWELFLNAVFERPWFGYGLRDVLSAQWEVADQFPTLQGSYAHSHNLFIDILIWFGLPLGLCICVYLTWLIIFYACSVSDAKEAILVMFLGVIGIHAMLELPLHYAYFLLPTGLVVGFLNARFKVVAILRTPQWSLVGLYLVTLSLFIFIVKDYVAIEEGFRRVRLERALNGATKISPPADVILLTHLKERIRYIRYEAHAGMTEQEINWSISMAELEPGVGIFKAAKALALNKRPEHAHVLLKKMCKMSDDNFCNIAQRVWANEGLTQPDIAVVVWPE